MSFFNSIFNKKKQVLLTAYSQYYEYKGIASWMSILKKAFYMEIL